MDNVGNRVTVTNGTTKNYTTNELNQYTAINGEALTYDLNGDMTFDGYNTISYDYANRAIIFKNADYAIKVRYDSIGRRVEKFVTDRATSEVTFTGYVYDGKHIVSDINISRSVINSYLWCANGGGLIASAKGNSTKYTFYLNNNIRSIMHVTNAKAELKESYSYKVYGQESIFSERDVMLKKSKEKNRFRFMSNDSDDMTKTMFMTYGYSTSRYYSPKYGSYYQRYDDSRYSVNQYWMRDYSGYDILPILYPVVECSRVASAGCNFETGSVDIKEFTIDKGDCSYDCVIAHEKSHVNDRKACCKSAYEAVEYYKTWSKSRVGRVKRMYAEWVHATRKDSQCLAYKAGVDKCTDLYNEKDCDSVLSKSKDVTDEDRKAKKCCHKIKNHIDYYGKKAEAKKCKGAKIKLECPDFRKKLGDK